MSRLDMADRLSGTVAAPAVASFLTLLLTLLTAAAVNGAAAGGTRSTLALLVLMPAPMVVAGAWGVALMLAGSWRWPLAGAGVWLVAGWLLVPHEFVGQMAGYVAAGLLAGTAWAGRWRFDAAILVVALVLSPLLVWTMAGTSAEEQLRVYSGEMLKVRELGLPAGADETQRDEAMALEIARMDQVVGWVAKMFPALLAVGVLGQSVLILVVFGLGMRLIGWTAKPWRLPPFSRWRVPFYVVWVLVLGLGLLVTRQPGLTDAGLNIVLLAAGVLSVQGMAVQFFVTGRIMSGPVRVVYWSVIGFFFAPLVMASGVIVGLVDQWWDIRRLDAATVREGDESDDEAV